MNTLFDLSELETVTPQPDRIQKPKKETRPKLAIQQFDVFESQRQETIDRLIRGLYLVADQKRAEVPSRQAALKRLAVVLLDEKKHLEKQRNPTFDEGLAEELKELIINRERFESDPLDNSPFTVIAYRKGFEWGKGKTDYLAIIKTPRGYLIPGVEVGGKKLRQLLIFHKTHWSDLDWYHRNYTFVSPDEFRILWEHLIKECPNDEQQRKCVHVNPSDGRG